MAEKPAWVERLKSEDRFEGSAAKHPVLWYRIIYFIFGYIALGIGVYLLINGIIYSPYIQAALIYNSPHTSSMVPAPKTGPENI